MTTGAPARPAAPPAAPTPSPAPVRSPATALFRQAVTDGRVRTIAFAYIFVAYAWLQAAGYRSTFPTAADRAAFAHSFAGNDAIRLFYGYPYEVLTVGGYSAWRVGGTLSLAAAAFGFLAAVRALRAEEEAGRSELVLAGAVGRRTAYLSAMSAAAVATFVLWAAEFVGFLLAKLPVGGSAYLALATAVVVPLFAGLGALASQLAPTRRGALALSSAAAALFWLLRVVGDTWRGGAWVRWTTPLGWAEELRPFAGARPAVLVLFVVTTAVLVVAAGAIALRRDVGTGLFAGRDEAEPRFALLSSPLAHTVRAERHVLAVWAVAFAAFAAVIGMIATSISGAGISAHVKQEFAKFGTGALTTPSGYLSFVFIVFVLAASYFACSQVGAAREEEAQQRLETVLAQPVGRGRWLLGRLVVAGGGVASLSVLTGLCTWAGAASQGVAVSLPGMLLAGANCAPTAVLFLGLAALAYAVVPRAASAVSYGLVSVAFLWYVVGSLFRLPAWVVDLTPYRHIGLVPAQPFDTVSAVGMGVVGVVAASAALAVFRRRDLLSA